MAFHRGPKIITDGLVLSLDAANQKSYPGEGTTWSDLSGNGNNGTLINGPTFDSENNGSLVFDGVNDYGQSDSTGFSASGNCTLSVWAKSDTYITQAGILSNKSYFSVGEGIAIGNQSSPQRVSVIVKTDAQTVARNFSSDSVYDWTNFTVTKNGNTVNLYKNGSYVGNQTFTGTITDSGNISFGRYLGYEKYWSGNIGPIQIFNRDLTVSEVLQNYNAIKSRYNL